MEGLAALRDRYRLGAEIGRGGLGAVYRAEDLATGAPAAIKLPLAVPDPEERARIRREAARARDLRHPNLVRFLELLEADEGRLALAYELIEGRSLDRVLAAADRPPEALLALAGGVAAGLDALHAAELVYRDLKPENVMVRDQGQAVLVDLGLVRAQEAGDTVTREGSLLATPAYVAPELLRGQRATPASDRYALGCLLYRMVAGRPPFEGTALEVARGHLSGAIPPIERPALGDTRRLGFYFSTALAREPTGRFGSAAEMVEELGALLRPGGDPEPGPQATRARTVRVASPPPPAAASTWPELPRVRDRVPGGDTGRRRRVAGSGRRPRPRRRVVARLALAAGGALLLGLALRSWRPGPPGAGGLAAGARAGSGDAGPGAAWLALARAELGVRRSGPLTDPLEWGEAVGELRSVRQFRDWLLAGGRPEELAPELRTGLVDLDPDFEAAGLVSPLTPFLELTPAPEDGLVPAAAARLALDVEVAVRFPPRVGPWLRRALEEFVGLEELVAQLEAELQENAGGPYPGDVSLGVARAFYAFDRVTLETFLQVASHNPENRRRLQPWLFEPTRRLRLALAATARSLAEEPETRELAALVAVARVRARRALLAGALTRAPLALLLGRAPESPPARWLAAELHQAQIEVGFHLQGVRGTRDLELVPMMEAAAGPGEGALAAYRRGEARVAQVAALLRLGRRQEVRRLAPALEAALPGLLPRQVGRLQKQLHQAGEG